MTSALARTLQKYGRMAQFRDRSQLALVFYAGALALDPGLHHARREYHRLRPRRPGTQARLRFVALGTTGTCNASCIHCPTGKAITAQAPRSTMPMEMFRTVIDGIVTEGLPVDSLAFGLFGDGLVDPLVEERARYARERLPDVMIDINTNGAAFDAKRHGRLAEDITILSLHCESIRPETYDRLMTPLRAKNVFPKYEPILASFPKVRVSVPVSRINLGDLEETRDWFMARGAYEVVFDPLASRCVEDPALFESLALAPLPIRCAPDIMNDLIVDCDGLVLSCCQDFERREPIGDLGRQSFTEMLADPRRAAFGAMLDEGRHGDAATCSRCNGDPRTSDFPFGFAARALETA